MPIIEKTIEFVKQRLSGDASGHDWWHIHRVWSNAKTIASHYPQADILVIELAALLHDIADWKDHNGNFDIGPKVATEWLQQFEGISHEQINEIAFIIKHVSFKGANAETVELSLEGQIVQDADRLDAIGAIGIARTFAFGGSRGSLMYDPNIQPKTAMNEKAYVHKNKGNTTINHFYEKLLLLKDRLNTETGKQMANHRHQYMEDFLKQFYAEWNGEK